MSKGFQFIADVEVIDVLLDADPEEAHDVDAHGVAKGSVPVAIGNRLPVIGNEGVVVAKPLQPLTLDRHEAANGHVV